MKLFPRVISFPRAIPFPQAAAAALALAGLTQTANAVELTVYSSRNASYIKPMFDDYSRETGVAVRYLVASPAMLISRLKVEGKKSPADLFLTTGADNLWSASEQGLLAPVESRTLQRNVPEHLLSPKNDWFALSKRARTLIYNPDKVSEDELQGYADLAQPKWQGKLCLRTSSADYSKALVAMMVEHNGEESTKQVLQGWVNNLAVAPFAEDMQVAEAISQGQCDVGIINTYYYARLKREQPDTKLKLFWADQDSTGVHINITGAAVTANAPNKQQALDLLEWLTTKRPQVHYTNLNMEYPVNSKVYPAREVARWGKFEEDKTPVVKAGENRAVAVELVKAVGYQ